MENNNDSGGEPMPSTSWAQDVDMEDVQQNTSIDTSQVSALASEHGEMLNEPMEEDPSNQGDLPTPILPEIEEEGDNYVIEGTNKPPRYFKGSAKVFTTAPIRHSKDYVVELSQLSHALEKFLLKQRAGDFNRGLKVHCNLQAKFDVIKENILVDTTDPFFDTKSTTIFPGSSIEEEISPIFESLSNQIADYKVRGSGFQFSKLTKVEITITKFSHAPVGCYLPLPQKVHRTHAVINIRPTLPKDENFCFVDSILALIYPAKGNRHRPSNYRKYRPTINMSGLPTPMDLAKLPTFERLNPHLSINVYQVDPNGGRNGNPLYFIHTLSKNTQPTRKKINLLLIEEGDKNHICAITNLDKLTRSSNSHHTGSVTHCCPRCLQHVLVHLFPLHESSCKDFKEQATILPAPGSSLKFTKLVRTVPPDYYIIGKFVCVCVCVCVRFVCMRAFVCVRATRACVCVCVRKY